MAEKIFDSNWKKTMTVLERDALAIARKIVGSIKTDSVFIHTSTESCLMSGNVVNGLYCFSVDSDGLTKSEKEVWASALLSEAAMKVRTKSDIKHAKKFRPGSIIWQGWGIISPTGLVLEAVREKRIEYLLSRLDSMHRDAKLMKVEAVLIPVTRRLKIK